MNPIIYKITTCKFIGMEKLDGVCRLAHNGYISRYCVLDSDEIFAIDIFTNERFYLLTKNETNQIVKTEKINLGHEYGVYMQSLNPKLLPIREQIKIQLAYFKFSLLNKLEHAQSKSKQNALKR